MHITDRSKDLIKSGGEWISSIELENIASSHPEIALAACIACAHPRWDERPLLVVVAREGSTVSAQGVLHFFTGGCRSGVSPTTSCSLPTCRSREPGRCKS
jgi:acyl-CoA synthetase (AMP-forming)/AMP-acid ligase II